MRSIWKFLLSFVIFVAVCAAGVGWYVEYEVEKGLTQAVNESGGLQLRYADCSVDILDHTVILTDVDATLPTGQHFTADEIRIHNLDQLNPLPYYATATASGMNIPTTTANFGDLATPMRHIGIASIKGDASLDYAYSPDTATLIVKELSVNDPELGHARLNAEVDQFDLINPRLEQFIGVRIKEATLHFSNTGLMTRLVRDWAARMRTSNEETVHRITSELASLARYADQQENRPAENVMLGLKRFLIDPGTMTMTAMPTEPVPVLYFFMGRDLMENLRLLDMKIETDSDDDV